MNWIPLQRMLRCGLATTVLWWTASSAVLAHDFRQGPLVLDHPYATPSPDGTTTASVYLKAIRNRGDQPDRLVGASTPVAGQVSLYTRLSTGDVRHPQTVESIALPARSQVRLGHGPSSDHHLRLESLAAPLREGDRFPLTLHFERAGTVTVHVWVQTLRTTPGHTH